MDFSKSSYLLWIEDGISQVFGSQSDSMWIFGLYSSLETRGLPEKNTFMRESLWKRVKDAVGFLFGLQVVGQNLRPRPIIVVRCLGIIVATSLRSCIERLDGRVK